MYGLYSYSVIFEYFVFFGVVGHYHKSKLKLEYIKCSLSEIIDKKTNLDELLQYIIQFVVFFVLKFHATKNLAINKKKLINKIIVTSY